MAIGSINNFSYQSQVGSFNTINTVSSAAKNIFQNSGFGSVATSSNSTGSSTFNKSIFNDLGNIREQASKLQSAMSSMASLTQFSPNISKAASSSNKDVLSASVANRAAVSSHTRTDVNVEQLATTQQNRSAELDANVNSFGDNFNLRITDSAGKASTFNVNVKEDQNNKEIMQAMTNQINSSNAGVRATLVENKDDGTVSMRLESVKTGATDGKFTVEDNSAARLDNVARASSNASYSVNGRNFTSQSNDVRIMDGVTATLNKTGSTQITYSQDMSSAVNQVQKFVDSYNSLRNAAKNSPELSRQLTDVTKNYSRALGYSGINMDKEGNLKISDEKKLTESVSSGSFSRNFQGISSFGNKLSQVARNAYTTSYNSAVKSNFANMVNTSNTSSSSSNLSGSLNWANMAKNTNSFVGLLFNGLA